MDRPNICSMCKTSSTRRHLHLYCVYSLPCQAGCTFVRRPCSNQDNGDDVWCSTQQPAPPPPRPKPSAKTPKWQWFAEMKFTNCYHFTEQRSSRTLVRCGPLGLGFFRLFIGAYGFSGFAFPWAGESLRSSPGRFAGRPIESTFIKPHQLGSVPNPLSERGGVWAAVSLVGYFRSFLWPERTGFWGRPPSFGFRCWIHTHNVMYALW